MKAHVMLPVSLTVPNPVVDLRASPVSTSSVRLEWADPLGVQAYYTYRVQTTDIDEVIFNNSIVIHDLQPGTVYHFNVSTVAQGSEARAEQAFSYTSKKTSKHFELPNLRQS